MRIFLGNSPWRMEKRVGVRAGSRWPFTMDKGFFGERVPSYAPFPFFLAYTTSVLEQFGHDVYLVDGVAEGLEEEEFLCRMGDFQPQLVVLETSTPTWSHDVRVAGRVREMLGPEARLAFTGPHVTHFAARVLEECPQVDVAALGEYEYTIRDLAAALAAGADGADMEKVEGLAWRDRHGGVRVNARRKAIMDLDALPWPAYRFLPMLNYNDDFTVLEKPNVQMWASRGCPYHCVYCMWPDIMYGGHVYRARSPKLVADEMEWLVDTYGFKGVYFDDDTFNIGKKRLLQLCQEITDRGLNVPWGAMARADTSDRETLEAMAKAGLAGIKFGVESAVQSIVDGCGKGLDLARVEESVEWARQLGVKVHLTFTFGLPGDTRETVEKTIEYALSKNVDSVQFSITTPFPGTRYFDMVQEQGLLLSTNWDDYDGARACVIRTDELTPEDLQEALQRAGSQWWGRRNSVPKPAKDIVESVS